MPDPSVPTLIAAIASRAEQHIRAGSDADALILLNELGPARRVSWSSLMADSGAFAAYLASQGVQSGDRVFLLLDHGYPLLIGFLGSLYLGAIPAVVPHPGRGAGPGDTVERLNSLIGLLGEATLVTSGAFPDAPGERSVPVIDLTGWDKASSSPPPLHDCAGQDEIAFLRFNGATSASLKALPLSHVAVLRHIDAMARGLQYQGSDISISCSPIHHEMGMLLGFLMPLVMGGTAVIMSPSHWFREPDFYLRAISDYRATMAWMPNVGFAVCTRRVRDEALARVDLNCLRVMGSASEPVRNNTIDAFTTRFAPWGLSPEAVTSAYGLAENVMLVSVTEPGVRPRVDWVLGRELHDAGCAKPVGPNSAGSVPVVSCGRPLPNSRIRIIDDDGHALDEREVGEVELSSDSLINDYLPELTEEDSGSQSGWFRTGDVGYLSDGELFLCDRRQDLIIVAGLKLLPRDVEQIAARVLGDRAGQCVAFGCLDNDLATERPVVVCEVSDSMAENLQAGLISQIRNATLYELNIGLKDLVLASPGWVVQLADGQPSRSDCRDKYLLGNSAKLPGGKAENPLMPVLDMSLTELLALPPDQRGITMTRKFCSLIEAVLNAPTGHVHADQTLAEAGVDSLSLIEVMIRLEQGLGVGLSLPGNEAQLRLGGLARHFLVLLERHQQRLARQGGADVMRGRYSGSTSHPHREKAGLGGVWQRLRGRR